MSDDRVYKDGDIVWVKLGNNWWPGEVTDVHRHPEGLLKHLKKKPYCVVKFFQEDAYEYIKNAKQIFPFQCSKKDEFIKKGTALYNAKNKFMEKFPSDVEIAERLTRKAVASDLLIINDRPDSIVKAILGPTYTRRSNDYYDNEYSNTSCSTDYNNKRRSGDSVTKILNITPQRTTTTKTATICTPDAGKILTTPLNTTCFTTNSLSVSSTEANFYRCNLCNFSSQRQNVMILHRRTHSAGSTPAVTSTTTRKTATATVTTANATNVSNNATSSPTTSSMDKSRYLSEDVDRKCAAKLVTTAACMAKSENNATPLNSRSASGIKNRQQNPLNESGALSRCTAGPSRQKLRSSLRIDADVTEITLPDGIPKGFLKGELKLTDYDTTDHSSSPMEEKLLRTCSPRKHNVDAGDAVDASLVLKSTAEEIRQRLLADWSDGEKEDEMMVDEYRAHENRRDLTSVESLNESPNNKLTAKATGIKTNENVYSVAMPIGAAVSNTVPQTRNPNQNRIRNIPKKDRRDAVLKEFTSGYTVTPPAAAVNLESINCSNSNSSDSVVVVAVVPPNSGETITIDDNTGTDGETETSSGKGERIGNETKAHSMPFNNTMADQNNEDAWTQNQNEIDVLTATQTRAMEKRVEYAEKPERYEEAQNTGTTAERLKNGEDLLLVPGEMEIVNTEENMQSISGEEADLKSEIKDNKSQVHTPIAKPRTREKRSKSNRRQKAAAAAKEGQKASIEITMKSETLLMPTSPQRLKEEDERPLTSSAAEHQKQRTDCFDFQEEEDDSCSDALKSIADFKKKYLSPDKSQEKALVDNGGVPRENEQRRSTEQKDQQLAYDIDKLLEQTNAPNIVAVTIPAVVARAYSYGSSKEELPVKGLPIKERGKRIFKSRNRSRIEETSPLTGVGLGVEGGVVLPLPEIVEPKLETLEEHALRAVAVAVAVVEPNQQKANKALIEESEQEAKVEQIEDLTTQVERTEEIAPPAVKPATIFDSQHVATVGDVVGIAGSDEIMDIEVVEELKVSKTKTVNNGSLGIAIQALGHASADEQKCENSDVNGENLGLSEIQTDPGEVAKQNVEEDVPINGNDFVATKQDSEGECAKNKHVDNNMLPEENLNDESDKETQPEDLPENCAESVNLNASEMHSSEIVQRNSSEEAAQIAANEEETLNTDLKTVSNEAQNSSGNCEQTTGLGLKDAHLSIDKQEPEVTFTEQQTHSDDKEIFHDTEDSLAAALKNDMADDQQQGAILMGEDAPQSRLTSPTDDNSSICISEAGAEFGSPTSMLDDERLPIITGRLMTPTEVLMQTMPAGNEEAKVLQEEQQVAVASEAENASEIQNIVDDLTTEVGKVETAQKAVANELINVPAAIAEDNHVETVEECNEVVENLTNAQVEHNETENASGEIIVDEEKHEEEPTEDVEQDANAITNALKAESAFDGSKIDAVEDYAAKDVEVTGTDSAENEELERMNSVEIEQQNETGITSETTNEIPAEVALQANKDVVVVESKDTNPFLDNIIDEVEYTRHEQSQQSDNLVTCNATKEQPKTDGAQVMEDSEYVNNASPLKSDDEDMPLASSEHFQYDDSDVDDDFIESPPHEPLSGHEGDTEPLSMKTKVLTKTRHTISKSDYANAPSNTAADVQDEAHIELEKFSPAPTACVSPKGFDEFTKEVDDSKRLTREAKQQPTKSNDYMIDLDLSDLHETPTKEDTDGPTPARQNQRKSTKVTKLTDTANETVDTFDKFTALQEITSDDALTTSPELKKINEHELLKDDTATTAVVPALKPEGSSRKRRGAIKIIPRRNASGSPNDGTKEITILDHDELLQQAKSRKVESSIDESIGVDAIQAVPEIDAAIEISNFEADAFDSLIEEVDPAEMAAEEKEFAEEQCIIEEVYENDTMSMQQIGIETTEGDNTATIENVLNASTSELNSNRTHVVPKAVDNVDYSPIEHQQPLEEIIVGAVSTAEATVDNGISLQHLQSSPNNAQPKADNVGINISPMEKVRINVDVANPLSTQIASILATKSAASAASKKSNLEESIPSFIIERPSQGADTQQPSSNLEFTIGEQDAVAHVQQMCPQVKITRKEKFIDAPPAAGVVQQESFEDNSGAMFDISNMPIVLGNEHFMSAQGDMQIVLTSSPEAETHLRTDATQILQQQMLQSVYKTPTQTAQQRQRKRSINQSQQQTSNANCQVGSNKHGIIIIKAAPSDLIIQQSQSQSTSVQVTQQQSQAIAGGAAQQLTTSVTEAKTTYNLGSGVTLRPIAEPKQKQQQRQQQQQQQQQQHHPHQQQQQMSASKPKSPAAAATSGRKQAGNTINLPSSITVKQRQQKLTDCVTSATVTAASTKTTVNAQQQQQILTTSVSGSNKAQKRNHPTHLRRSQSEIHTVQQRRLTATGSSVMELQEQQQIGRGAMLLNRRLSYAEAHAPPPIKIPRSADHQSESSFAATAEHQLLQLQQQQQQNLQQQRQKVQSPTTSVAATTSSQPPPLHPLPIRKHRHSLQQQRRMSTKAESSSPHAQALAAQEQQQRLQSTQMVLLDQKTNQCIEQQQQQQQQQQEQHMTAVHIAELAATSPPSAEEILPMGFEAVHLQAHTAEVYTEEILAEEFEANEHTPSVIAVPSQPVPGYPDTLLLCRRVDDEWVPVVAQPFFYTGSDQQLRPIPKEVLIGRPILTPSTDKSTEFPIETDELQMLTANETYKEETGVTILIGNNYVHMEWDQFLEVMRSNDDVYNLRDENGHVFQLTRDALVALQQDANLQDKYRQLQQLLEEQQIEEQQQLEQQELLQQQFLQQLQTVTVTGEQGLESDIIPLLHIDTTQTLQLIGTEDGNLILQPTLVQPPLSPPCTRPALTNATNALLNQTPIMSPLEKPSTAAAAAASLLTESDRQHIDMATATASEHLVAAGFLAADATNAMTGCRPTLGDSLAVIGVVPTQPTLLPTTVTNPAIAPPKSDLITNMTTAAQMHAQYRHAQRAIYNDPGS